MAFWNKSRQESKTDSGKEKSLYPVLHVINSLKDYHGEVGAGLHAVEQGTEHMFANIATSQKALGESIEKVDETYEKFDEIIHSAEGAATVHSEISKVIGESQSAMQMLCGFFEQIKSHYQEVMKHIRKAGSLGTTKSAMFEDMDNMMSQIPPIINEYTSDK